MVNNIEELIGKTLVSVKGIEEGSEEVELEDDQGKIYVFFHSQDCCEFVRLEEVHGDPQSLIGSPITQATESIESGDESTWTFYTIATVKGHVTLRWLGESNGYYSESVDFVIATKRKK